MTIKGKAVVHHQTGNEPCLARKSRKGKGLRLVMISAVGADLPIAHSRASTCELSEHLTSPGIASMPGEPSRGPSSHVNRR
jgi:hypothetical protein